MTKSWLMLAPSKSITEEQLKGLSYPRLVSPKIDGIRSGVRENALLTRSELDVPNLFTRGLFARRGLAGFDGELTVGPPFGDGVMGRTSSGVMAREGEPDVHYHVFDLHDSREDKGFDDRFECLVDRVCALPKELRSRVHFVPHHVCQSADDVLELEKRWLEQGYEGAMVRDPNGLYVPWKRTTIKQANVLKLKRFEDGEAIILGFEEEMENTNEVGNRGRRTSHKAGLIPKGRLGALVVRMVNGRFAGEEFSVGSGPGFANGERDRLWAERHHLKELLITVRYFPTGTKDKPRFPTFRGFRVPGT